MVEVCHVFATNISKSKPSMIIHVFKTSIPLSDFFLKIIFLKRPTFYEYMRNLITSRMILEFFCFFLFRKIVPELF